MYKNIYFNSYLTKNPIMYFTNFSSFNNPNNPRNNKIILIILSLSFCVYMLKKNNFIKNLNILMYYLI